MQAVICFYFPLDHFTAGEAFPPHQTKERIKLSSTFSELPLIGFISLLSASESSITFRGH